MIVSFFVQSVLATSKNLNFLQFGNINNINTYIFQSYPKVFNPFTFVKEVVITWVYPIIFTMKLRLSGLSVCASYLQICRYIVVLLQQLDLLLNILLSSESQLHDIIRVIWLAKCPHTNDDLRYFGWIRKVKTLKVLMWLKKHNILCKDKIINSGLTNTWKVEFISTDTTCRVL